MENDRDSRQESQKSACVFAAHYGPEMEVATRSCRARKRKGKRRCQQPAQEHHEMASSLGNLVRAAEQMEETRQSPRHLHGSELALHDHSDYCIPEEAEALKRLVRELRGTVHHQSELLFSLRGVVEASQKECQELRESTGESWTLLSDLGERISQLEAENRNLRCERDQLEHTRQRLCRERDASGAAVLSLSRQLQGQQDAQAQHRAFSLESIKGHSKWLRFYTGFDEYSRLAAFLDFLLDGKGSPENSPHSALSPENQLFLVLVRLRLGLLLQDVAFRFHISESTASRYWLSWMEIMEQRMRQIPVACSRRYVDSFKPQRSLILHDVPLLALDCAELFLEAQGRTRGKGETPWGTRARYSIPGYALAAPSGFLTFGAGTGEELPTLPPFLQAGPVQLMARQEASKRQVLSFRSLTDKAFSFRFLRIIHPQNMEGQVARAWTIACYLACLLHEPMGLV
ncbi:uncharacterized protein LOC123032220 isoform X2 [Varanus komodoensis]|uniref:uncharacterized protein LOC123032220 isoform X2 n=1 Tax=Varanus komodoensis TaxID=61221 RepID=UPI001CF78551|nr:uncharacterized protein LOC123032220 isoform X2 [Varanus komodoensis]